MWFTSTKIKIEKLTNQILVNQHYTSQVDKRKIDKEDILQCVTCGCLVFKSKAIEGEPKINKGYKQPTPFLWNKADWHKPEYTIERYFYCKRCAKDLESNAKETKNKKE